MDGGFEVPVKIWAPKRGAVLKNGCEMLFRVVVLASGASRRTPARAHPCTEWMRAVSPQLPR
eukprot:scaffold84564_cov57-Phaeocystis_antarctica.AAC.1